VLLFLLFICCFLNQFCEAFRELCGTPGIWEKRETKPENKKKRKIRGGWGKEGEIVDN